MKPILPHETVITGGWDYRDGHVADNLETLRITELISGVLTKIVSDSSGWSTLYKDPADGRFWELTYPDSEQHGGGAPRLTAIPYANAVEKYVL